MAIFRRGKFYWYAFTHNGRRIQKSTKQGDREESKKLMAAERSRLARVDAGLESETPLPKRKNVTAGELLDKLKAHYELHSKASVQTLGHLRRAKADFGAKMANAVSSSDVTKYQERRKEKGHAPASINRTLEILRRGYSLANLTPPSITRLPETNVRQGFFSREEFDKVLSFLPKDVLDFCLWGFLTGMRLGEIKSLAWSDVSENVIRLRGVNAKTKKPRSIVATGELAALLERRQDARAVKSEDGAAAVMASTVFHRHGEPVGEFRKSWATACVAAGVGKMICSKCKGEGADHWCSKCKVATKYRGRIFHDLRRSGVRNLIRAGVPQNIAMRISGHRTDATFRRYDICNEDDLAQAMVSLQKFHQTEQQRVVAIGATAGG